MKSLLRIFQSTALIAVLSLGLSACEHGHDHDHDHSHEGHDHHHHDAPHGGTLVTFGDHFAMMELVLDAKTGKLTAYVLDKEAEKSTIPDSKSVKMDIEIGKEKVSLELVGVANSLTGETKDKTSQFAASSEKLKGQKKFKATIPSFKVLGKEFKNVSFPFPEGNDEEAHKDEHKDDHKDGDHKDDHKHEDEHKDGKK